MAWRKLRARLEIRPISVRDPAARDAKGALVGRRGGGLDHGCLHVRCERCGDDMVVAFSCKGRSVCPSCGGRRMTELAAQLVDRVMPDVPVRQWVLSLPWSLRYQLAFDAALCGAVLAVCMRGSSAGSGGSGAPRGPRRAGQGGR